MWYQVLLLFSPIFWTPSSAWGSYESSSVYPAVCNVRSSRLEVFCKNRVLRNFVKFTEKHLCQSLFFNKIAVLRPVTLLKKRLWHRYFPMNFANASGGSFCNAVFSGFANYFFLIFYMKLWFNKYIKLTEPVFLRKILNITKMG